MKMKYIPLAMSAAAVILPSLSVAGPTIYGKLNVTTEYRDWNDSYRLGGPAGMNDADEAKFEANGGNADDFEVVSNASRFGVKGDADLTDSLKAIYKIEWQVDASGDDGKADLTQRNRYLGLKSEYGTLKFGKFDSPLKVAGKKMDIFSDLTADIKYTMVGEERLDNSINYTTPELMDAVKASITINPGEGNDGDDGIADSISASIEYKGDSLFVVAAYDSDVTSGDDFPDKHPDGLEFEKADAFRLVGEYKISDLSLVVLYQMAEDSDNSDLEQDAYGIGATYKIDDVKLKAQYLYSETENGGSDDLELDQITLGASYNFTKKTSVFAYVNCQSEDMDNTDIDGDFKVVGLGLEHKF